MEEKAELPQGWIWTTIRQIGKTVTGNTPSTSKPEFYGGSIPFFKPSDLGSGYALTEAETNLTKAGARSVRVLPAESILVTCIGATIGKTGFAKVAGTTNQQINALVPDVSIILPQFGYFAFISPVLFRQIIDNASSTTLPILNKSKFEALNFPLPPLPEQRRIVAKLEELFSRLDAGVAAVRRSQALLKRYRQSVLHAAVTGELTRAWREAHPTPSETGEALLTRIRAERRAQWEAAQVAKRGGQLPLNDAWKSKYVEPEAPDTSELPELPAGWVWASVEQLVSVGTGATPLKSNPLYHSEGTVPWVTSGALNNLFIREPQQFITELAVEETNAKVFPSGTLLVAMYGEGKTRGKVSELTFPAATNQACAALIFDDAANDVKEIVKLFFEKNYDDLRRLSSGGVQPNLNLSLIKATVVPLPPLAEQTEIVAEVERRLTVLDALSQTLTAELKRAERLRQSLLHRAFTGRLVPQEATDEPATALLARLQAETAAAPAKGKAGRKAKANSQIILKF